MTIFLLVAGLFFLVVGSELLVRGASALAAAIGLSPLVIGLTIVAFGTSAPELFVSVKASMAAQSDIALGNVVGSNIFNVLFILGVSALICPLIVSQQLVRWDVPIMIAVSIAVFLFSLDGKIGFIDGTILFSGILAYTFFAIRMGKKESAAVKKEYEKEYESKSIKSVGRPKMALQILWIVLGLVCLVLGAGWFVDSAIKIARHFGVSELVIALTIVAAGTSLPEVATSIMASIKGERDIAVGNVVGSNIFNLLAILGVSAWFAGSKGIAVAPAALSFDLPVMIAVAAACLPIFFSGNRISRWEGALFLAYYAVYTAFLLLKSSNHDALSSFSAVMITFVLPLTAVTLAVICYREKRKRAAGHS